MHLFTVFLAVSAAALANGAVDNDVDSAASDWNNFHVTWSNKGKTAHDNGEAFFPVPLTAKDAEKAGWVTVPDDWCYGDVWCPKTNPTLCILTNSTGGISGFDVNIFKEFMNDTPYDMSSHFIPASWNGRDLNRMRMTFESPENLENGIWRAKNFAAGLWVNGEKIPTNSKELEETTAFVKENCVASMGGHYYYNMTPELQCEDFHPAFLLTNVTTGKVIGMGIQTYGHATDETIAVSYETIPVAGIKLIAPTSPDCMTDWVAKSGLISIHMFFKDDPWYIVC